MYILGISCYYHDASAALLKDGEIVAAAEEERFTRKKHDASFPLHAIRYCLESSGITANDLSYIGFYEKPFLKLERVLFQHLSVFPRSLKTFLKYTPGWLTEKLRVIRTIRKKMKYKGPVLFVEHHRAHAASTFLVSPFEKAAIVTVDGVGEWATTTIGMGKKNDVQLLKEICFPHSLGLLYSTITAYLGFTVNNAEYKVMGLSAYGAHKEKNKYYDKLRSVIDIKEDGSYRLDMSYFSYLYRDRMPSKKLCALLGGPIRKKKDKLTQRHKDIAAALQMIVEDVMTKILTHAHKATQCDSVVLSGGVGLNSVFNGKILRRTPFKHFWAQPNASDGGTSIGAASYIYHSVLGNPRRFVQTHAYLGPAYDSGEIKKFLDENSITHTRFRNSKERVAKTARLIRKGNVVGWFQGRMEWGPRALGARSILSDPTNPKMKEILNLKVKHREKFRPFAPAVCADDAARYFECDEPIPAPADFMLMVYPVRREWQKKIPSVVHIDGSGRLQTVKREQNPLYYGLIKEFGKLSGIPILINTSFNIRGEPIVCTPHDAYKCMMGTQIDYIVMGDFLVARADNMKDAWDSEAETDD